MISGRVLDELGEPIAGVMVWAMQLRYYEGARRMVPMGGGNHATTDDTGQYRLLALPPGDYLVMALSRETWPLDSDPRQVFGYAPSYYPGTAAAAEGQRIKVGVGQEVGSVDFALIPGRTLKVSGTLVSASGLPLAGESVSLSQEVRGPTMSTMFAGASVRTGADGTFTFLNVQAGEYQMTARVAARADQPAQEAQLTLALAGADVDGLMLVAGSGGTLRGQVVTDDGSPLPHNVERLTVRARSLTPGARNVSVGAQDNGSVDKDGNFQVRGLFGPVVLSIGVLTGDWTLKAVEHEGRDLADEPIEVPHGETLSGVRVVLTSRPTHLRGALVDEKGKRAEGTIIIFPEESGRWRERSRSIRSTRPDQNGEFSFKGLPPGNYPMTALDYVQDGQWNDPEFLETLKSRAERVAFGEGENKRVDLTLRK